VIIDIAEQIGTTVDIEERKGLYEDLQNYMMENPPFIYLYEPMAFEAIRDTVQDYRPRGAEEYYLWYTWDNSAIIWILIRPARKEKHLHYLDNIES
jgi:ABC-type transport system substrate-binding protein